MPDLFDHLWRDYAAITPSAPRIHALLRERGETIVNDHVALRTFDLPPIDLRALAAPFEARGWRATGEYRFREKKLLARSYSHPEPRRPRVFISQLETAAFSPRLQEVARELAAAVARSGRSGDALLREQPSWPAVPQDTYRELLAESEYAGWLAAFGIRANHFTVSINALRGFDSVAGLNAWLRAQGFTLNAAGGEVKGSPAVLLEQSSTLADRIEHTFAGGDRAVVPSCYYEFALRYPDPATGALFDLFVEQSADRIFESTDTRPRAG
jgi:hypothetical protein